MMRIKTLASTLKPTKDGLYITASLGLTTAGLAVAYGFHKERKDEKYSNHRENTPSVFGPALVGGIPGVIFDSFVFLNRDYFHLNPIKVPRLGLRVPRIMGPGLMIFVPVAYHLLKLGVSPVFSKVSDVGKQLAIRIEEEISSAAKKM